MPQNEAACPGCQESRELPEQQEDWSALLDGELCEEREAELRGYAESCPACADRLEAFRSVDELLAAVPLPEIPRDLRARLEARLASEGLAPAGWRPPAGRLAPGTRRLVRNAAGLVAAAAAALALYLAVVPAGGPPEPAPLEVAETAPPAELLEPTPGSAIPSISPTPPIEVAEAPLPPAEVAPTEPSQPAEAAPDPGADLDAASDEELALMLEIETLEDLDAIANLDLLERMLQVEGLAGGAG